ncbi:MAG: ABC transporter ATP-binding protein [Anaerolineae bacterium]|nr:ABC transporter ATP-binding protein [Anaerolineae bacterium]
MGFILDGLDTESYDRNYSDRDLLKRILQYFSPHNRAVIIVGVLILLNSAASTAGPILISKAIDQVVRNPIASLILMFAGGVLLLNCFAWLANYARRQMSAHVIGDVVLQVRQDVFRATVGHDLSFYDEHSSGKIVSRVTSDTQDFSNVVTLSMDLISQVLLVVILTVWLVNINVWLTLLLIALTPLAAGIALSFRRIARKVTRESRRVNAKINAQIQESISGIVVAKSFRQEHAIYQIFRGNNRQSYRIGLRRDLTMNTIFPIMSLTSGIASALLIYTSGLATRPTTLWGGISPGNWYLFMMAVGSFWWPMINIASFWSQFQDGLSAAERVFALIDAEPKVAQTATNPIIVPVQGHIEFRNISFSYTDKETILRDFSLDIRPRETVALVGHTGAGKSSIARLVMRFYEFQKGELLVDGQDIRSLDLQNYRQHIGMVPQDPFLFSGTVRDNIRYGLPEAGDTAVYEAAMHISHGDWIADLPDGLDTDIGERGANLSMGQRQLVALARVLLKNPAIFVLDEATASVDPFTEAQIQEGLETLMRDRTAIIIAHRLSTIKHADRIIVMDHGSILEEGTHADLIARSGHYATLYNTYFRHQSLSYIENFETWSKAPVMA